MNYLRRHFAWSLCAASLVMLLGAWRISSYAEETEEATPAPAAPAEDTAAPVDETAAPADNTADTSGVIPAGLFTVPDGSATDLLAYIEKLARPKLQFDTSEQVREYSAKAATAIGEAADKVLAQKATDQQQIEAVHWKLESYRIQGQLGDADADKQATEFLDKVQKTASPQVVEALKELRLIRNLRQWATLDAAQRSQVVDDFIADMKTGDIGADQVFLLYRFVDMLSDTPDSNLATRMIDQLVPRLKEVTDPQAQPIVTEIEGIGRRLNLPGNQIEIEGTFLNGKPIDWNSYRSKVVLVDFWATDCGFCLAEMPNLLKNYRLFHDKGFDIVGISLDTRREPVEQYMKESGIPWQTLFQENANADGWDHPVASKYAIEAIPRLILVDQQGKVVSMNARGRQLTAELEKLLGAPAADANPKVDDEVSNQQPPPTLTAAPPAP
jgi:thiol-disulfide isomerase/thioredoxin